MSLTTNIVAGYLIFSVAVSVTSNTESLNQDLKGKALKKHLYDKITGHTSLPYTRSDNRNWNDLQNIDVWEALTYTDSACPNDPNCQYIHLLYLNEPRAVSKANRGGGDNDSWEREHVWPKSRGFPKRSQHGYTDLHHIRPADRNINGDHSNYGYYDGSMSIAEAEMVVDHSINGDKPSGALINRKMAWFVPTNAAKGQVARMIFYMDVRYDGSDTSISKMPDLQIVKGNARVKTPVIGDLCTLLQWNRKFPVERIERQRNNRIEEIQGNRNPFIDDPLLADRIWGHECPQEEPKT